MADVPKETVVEKGFKIGISTDKNNRKTMEDAHRYICNYNDVPGQGFFAVYDGHVNKLAADFCSEQLHKILSDSLKEDAGEDVLEILNNAFLKTDKELEVFLKTDPESGEKKAKPKASGCTAAVSFVKTMGSKRALYTANVGDTRSVLCRDGVAERLTYDHKGSDEKEKERIEKSGGSVWHDRVSGMLAVTRSLGDCHMKEYVVGNPYTTRKDLASGDILIIACDGLWDVCKDSDAADMIKDIADPKEASNILLKHAKDNYTRDNITIMVIHFTDDWTADNATAEKAPCSSIFPRMISSE